MPGSHSSRSGRESALPGKFHERRSPDCDASVAGFAELRQRIRSMLGDNFAVAASTPGPCIDEIFPEERAYISRAVLVRQIEFASARICARAALAELGVEPVALVPHPDRSPRWPPGATGSISHTEGCCVAVATNAPDVLAVGFDIEACEPLDHRLTALICRSQERSKIAVLRSHDRQLLLMAYFVAKEAVYKCQYTLTQEAMGFLDVGVEFCPSLRRFHVSALGQSGLAKELAPRIVGEFQRLGRYAFATAVYRNPCSCGPYVG